MGLVRRGRLMPERTEMNEVTRSVVIKCMKTIEHDTGSGYFWVPRIEVNWM